MKLLRIITIIALLSPVLTKAQNPFKEFGYEVEFLTLSDGKYDEFFENDTIMRIGTVYINTITERVIGFVEEDTMYSEATLEPEIVSRWLSPDPLARKFPNESPYIFVGNSPIMMIDIGGMFKWPSGEEAEYEANYPTLSKYLNANKANFFESGNISELLKSDRFVWGMVNNSKGTTTPLTISDLLIDFQKGNGPVIQVTEGPGSYEAGGVLYLNKDMLNSLENGSDDDKQAALTWIVSTIAHEYLEQYTDDNLVEYDETGNPTGKTTGCIPMEIEVWGSNLHSVEDGKEAIELRTTGSNSESSGDIDESVIPTLPKY